jgi:hypothetical protein
MKKRLADITEEEIYQDLLVKCGLAPKPKPTPAVVRAKERWADKPAEVKILDATAQNEEVVDCLREARRNDELLALRQSQLDAYWQSILNARTAVQEYAGCHRGPGDSDWRR